jgi:hypothetical protein
MTAEDDRSNFWVFLPALGLAFAGALVAGAGAGMVFSQQARISASPLWPLPGLVLMEWAALGMLGFLGAYLGRKSGSIYWRKIAWCAAGALLPLVILGAWSIGTLVLVSLLLLLGSSALIALQTKEKWLPCLGFFLASAMCNLGLLWIIIVISNGF